MSRSFDDLTPRQIVAELDRYIVGQAAAKRAVAVALRNRVRRLRLDESEQGDITPKNILMAGPTGVGKTEIARRLAQLAHAPFVKVEATKFTEVGYVGRDVESMVRDLVASSYALVEREHVEKIRHDAKLRAIDQIIDRLDLPRDEPEAVVHPEDDASYFSPYGFPNSISEEKRAELRISVQNGEFDDQYVDVDLEESNTPFAQVFTQNGMEEMGIENLFGKKVATRRLLVPDALERLTEDIGKNLVDTAGVKALAIKRAEEAGIIFIDEIDKIAGSGRSEGPDVSREGVQRDLLPIIEGSAVQTRYGTVRTDHILFICAGAFHISKPDDLIPELQGRLPIRVTLEPLEKGDFRRILKEPKNALTEQYRKLLAVDGVELTFEDAALDEIAEIAVAENEKLGNIGARRLHTLLERLLQDALFDAPDGMQGRVMVDRAWVRRVLDPMHA